MVLLVSSRNTIQGENKLYIDNSNVLNAVVIFNFKKYAKALALILLGIIITSTCQRYLGAENTLLDKFFLLDLKDLVYEGCALGSILTVFFKILEIMWGILRQWLKL